MAYTPKSIKGEAKAPVEPVAEEKPVKKIVKKEEK